MTKRLMALALGSAALVGCGQPSMTDSPGNNEAWQATYPAEYQSWAETENTSARTDLLAHRPALVVLWAGSPYAKEFHSPRGHQFAVADVAQTLRTADGQGSAACWSCKSPDVPGLMEKYGENGFAAHTFAELGREVGNAVGCADCHEPGESTLRLSRPYALNAMNKVKQPFEAQNASWQASQTCGQCHVTYYFQPEEDNKVNIPWIFGSTADEIERYYDTRRFYDWVHPISGAPMVKARHPEYEHWSRSGHAKLDVGCVDCHMAGQSAEGMHNHKVSGAMAQYEQACQGCHQDEAELAQTLAQHKAAIDEARTEVEGLLIQAHYEAQAAWAAEANWHEMNSALMDIRHAQWRWDFATSSHGIHAHNPEEGMALLTVALQQVKMARAKLAQVLAERGVDSVDYPDVSSKETAQAAVDIDLPALQQQKQRFIEQQMANGWPEAAMRGYQE
ncbi:ammonia-forming cytochrome c nitrite reductase subunit c552 [Ferrimonas marina]|nr:ammonia-forming cytochrome c nitrite reductase subunit c552 [Ferrimonas marina]